jgi:hypothetical protein
VGSRWLFSLLGLNGKLAVDKTEQRRGSSECAKHRQNLNKLMETRCHLVFELATPRGDERQRIIRHPATGVHYSERGGMGVRDGEATRGGTLRRGGSGGRDGSNIRLKRTIHAASRL